MTFNDTGCVLDGSSVFRICISPPASRTRTDPCLKHLQVLEKRHLFQVLESQICFFSKFGCYRICPYLRLGRILVICTSSRFWKTVTPTSSRFLKTAIPKSNKRMFENKRYLLMSELCIRADVLHNCASLKGDRYEVTAKSTLDAQVATGALCCACFGIPLPIGYSSGCQSGPHIWRHGCNLLED